MWGCGGRGDHEHFGSVTFLLLQKHWSPLDGKNRDVEHAKKSGACAYTDTHTLYICFKMKFCAWNGSCLCLGKESFVLLLSLEHAASGTNLTAANHVIFVHPMNAETLSTAVAYERQALARVRRVGQERDEVHVWRFIAKDTVEEYMHKWLSGRPGKTMGTQNLSCFEGFIIFIATIFWGLKIDNFSTGINVMCTRGRSDFATATVGSQEGVFPGTFLMSGSGTWVQPQRHAMFVTCRQCLVATSQATSCNTFRWCGGCCWWSIDEQFDDMTCCYPSKYTQRNPRPCWGCMGSWGIVQIACPGWTKKMEAVSHAITCLSFRFISKSNVAPFGFLQYKRTQNLTTLERLNWARKPIGLPAASIVFIFITYLRPMPFHMRGLEDESVSPFAHRAVKPAAHLQEPMPQRVSSIFCN